MTVIVWIVRYGLTKFPLVEDDGPYDSPIDPTEGVEHAKAIAARIASGVQDKPTVVYSSPFVRTTETASFIAQACSEDDNRVDVRIEDGLTEWQIPSLLVVKDTGIRTYPKSTKELAEMFSNIDASYASVNPFDETVDGSPQFPETEEQLLKRCQRTIDLIIEKEKHQIAINGEMSSDSPLSICIVSHAPCDQAIAYALEGAKSPFESTLTPWPLGGITKIVDNKIVQYGDTSHMPGIYKEGTKHWSLPCLEKK